MKPVCIIMLSSKLVSLIVFRSAWSAWHLSKAYDELLIHHCKTYFVDEDITLFVNRLLTRRVVINLITLLIFLMEQLVVTNRFVIWERITSLWIDLVIRYEKYLRNSCYLVLGKCIFIISKIIKSRVWHEPRNQFLYSLNIQHPSEYHNVVHAFFPLKREPSPSQYDDFHIPKGKPH